MKPVVQIEQPSPKTTTDQIFSGKLFEQGKDTNIIGKKNLKTTNSKIENLYPFKLIL